jgi:hypothetical protein
LLVFDSRVCLDLFPLPPKLFSCRAEDPVHRLDRVSVSVHKERAAVWIRFGFPVLPLGQRPPDLAARFPLDSDNLRGDFFLSPPFFSS